MASPRGVGAASAAASPAPSSYGGAASPVAKTTREGLGSGCFALRPPIRLFVGRRLIFVVLVRAGTGARETQIVRLVVYFY